MHLFKHAADLKSALSAMKAARASVGFVPTMGALHEGHLSLVRRSKSENAVTVCSIYVNPAQFNDPNDLEKYPRPIERDIELLASVSCDVLFLPPTEEVYPNGLSHLKHYDLGHLEHFLEGASRPGHFNGVANVVDRLLHLVEPDRLYLGQKDFQQVKVVEHVISGSDFQVSGAKPAIVMCPIVREADGLAMSSRNIRLTATQRKNAAGISRELFFIHDHWKEYSASELKRQAIHRINTIPEAQVDYLEFCDAGEFTLITDWKEARQIVCVTSVIVGAVRLLDNILLN
ncbi:MAG: pantoate--beta-alanine ligase [Chloroflexi bacterium]|nr:pantoate--beta-alanine ligase [Chloroflexota bacterium]